MKNWITCDGLGQPTVSRRGLLTTAGIGALGLLGAKSAVAQLAFSPNPAAHDGNVMVVLFLRGGADGLSFVIPHRDDGYYSARPTLAIAKPGKARDAALDLDGFFGLHPSLAPLLPAFREGSMAVVHAVGSQDGTHSHFEAMSAMERGAAREGKGPSDGWVARYLAATEHRGNEGLRAVAIGTVLPDSLRGTSHATLMESVQDYRLQVDDAQRQLAMDRIAHMYARGEDAMSVAGRETLRVLKTLQDVKPGSTTKAQYPTTDLGQGFQQVAALIRAEVGLEVACLDKGGWDTHVGQGVTTGWLPGYLDELGKSLEVFFVDLGARSSKVTVVVMTEFGRRVRENTGYGTDHGHGGVMLVLGGGVKGGKVYGRWPGLAEAQLSGPGDLAVTTDYRDVLGDVLHHRTGQPDLGQIFEGFATSPVGLMA